jgi:hypothetical protein
LPAGQVPPKATIPTNSVVYAARASLT